MSTTTKRIRQLMIGIFAILSLSVSSVAACACSHHEPEDAGPKTSCHGKPSKKHGKHSDQTNRSSSFSESCFCIQTASKVSVKAEGFKFKKHVSAFTGYSVPESGSHDLVVASVAAEDQPVSLSDPHRSTLYSRGPPAS